MDTVQAEASTTCHVVAMPYPGRGHVNPMMNLCKFLSSKKPDILITFVITEEWHGFIGSETRPTNVKFATLPNVIPSEIGRSKDFVGFVGSVSTKMEAPFEQLLDGLDDPPVSVIIADTFLDWVTGVGNRRKIPVATLWTQAATVFSIFYHSDLLLKNYQFPENLSSEKGDERIDYIPGVSSTRLSDFPSMFFQNGWQIFPRTMECISWVSKAQYLLISSVYELEAQVMEALKPNFPFPVYTLGPIVPCFRLSDTDCTDNNSGPDYIEWLNCQPKGSVLYVAMGSFLSVSSAHMDEIVAGLKDSGVRFMLVARDSEKTIKQGSGDRGLVVPWCDQLRALCHPSVGGFLTHCGWNSTQEGVFAGVPMLTFPVFWEQGTNGKIISEDWQIGWRMKRHPGDQTLMGREEIAALVKRFMDPESSEVKEMRKRASELKHICDAAISKGGSSYSNLESFIRDVLQAHDVRKSGLDSIPIIAE
ncbi:hypothetical protein K2173_016435 [Erythroxylum novogranatense]|uniref:Glycosyltransferase n=1 Tax=Erythroxylum novogranatense TaxID=1862640 RepID=A0AAV8SGJ3_9ROSI|nr:hypothetical protein K2173_016435 [Erythroxylum novogranatense]